MRENKNQISEMTIPSTPFLGLSERQDEKPQPKTKKKRKKESKEENRNSTETVSVVPSTPEKLDYPCLDESL